MLHELRLETVLNILNKHIVPEINDMKENILRIFHTPKMGSLEEQEKYIEIFKIKISELSISNKILILSVIQKGFYSHFMENYKNDVKEDNAPLHTFLNFTILNYISL